MTTRPRRNIQRFKPNDFARQLFERRARVLTSTSEAERVVLRELLNYRKEILAEIRNLKTDADGNLLNTPEAMQRLTDVLSGIENDLMTRLPGMSKQVTDGAITAFTKGAADAGAVIGAAGFDVSFNQFFEEAATNSVKRGVFGSKPAQAFDAFGVRLRERIGEIVRGGIVRGQSIDMMSGQLRRDLGVSAGVASRVIRNHVNAAQNEGILDTYKQNADILDGKKWDATLDSRTSVICASLHGTVVPLDGTFPGGFDAPPAHHNCRSTIIPVFIDPELNELTEKQAKRVREEFIDENGKLKERDSFVDVGKDFEDWLEDQNTDVQDRILGSSTKGELWRDRKISIDEVLRDNMSVASDEEVKRLVEAREKKTQIDKTPKKITSKRPAKQETDAPEKAVTATSFRDFKKTTVNKIYSDAGISEKTQNDLKRYAQYKRQLRAYQISDEEFQRKTAGLRSRISNDVGSDPDALLRRLDSDLALSNRARKPAEIKADIDARFNDDVRRTIEDAKTRIGTAMERDSWRGARQMDVKVKAEPSARAFYDKSTGSIHIGKKFGSRGVKSVAHEYGHHLESDPAVFKAAREFLEKRTANERAQSLRSISNLNYGRSEKAKRDKFYNPYVGKIYDDGTTEVISMGLERFVTEPEAFRLEDEEHFRLIYNILRGRIKRDV